MPRARDSEIDAYSFIKKYLAIQGWVVKNPNRIVSGQVYTQTECLDNEEIQRGLGETRPENIVKISEKIFYVIEAKRHKEQISQALREAENDYANKINDASRNIKVKIISGVAGNDTDGFIVKSRFLKDGTFQPIKINSKEITSFVSPQIAQILIETDNPEIKELPVDEHAFLETAEKINEILHLGAINKNYRARVMAALLLSMIDDTRPNVDAAPRVLIGEINSRADNILTKNGKQEFLESIKIALPPSPDNHIKFKTALVKTIQELENLNIRSAMNSGTDILGKFYEVFLKYGNGAKEIGIVLTPRHITRFVAEVMNVNHNDIIYDPTCGTGGFLVAAFDRVKKSATGDQIDYFKNYCLYGIEQEPEVAALAIVNMIFRGDGKNNIIEGNCLNKSLIAVNYGGRLKGKFVNNEELPEVHTEAVSKVLMNPPFSLKNSEEKEYAFINHALSQMKNGGILFSVLPYSSMAKQSGYDTWRKNLMQDNTLLAVLTFPQDLFYPISEETVGVFLKKGTAHSEAQKVLWCRALNDGLLKKKGKRLPSSRATNDLTVIKDILSEFLTDQSITVPNKAKFLKATKIDWNDSQLELVPEVYLDDDGLTKENIKKEMIYLMKQVLSFKVKYNGLLTKIKLKGGDNSYVPHDRLDDLFTIEYGQREYHSKENLRVGKTIVISSQITDNGCYGFFNTEAKYHAPFITVPSTGSVGEATVQEYDCCVDDNCLVLIPKTELTLTQLYFIAAVMRLSKWRFSYGGRKITPNRIRELKIPQIKIPITNKEAIDTILSSI